MIEPSSPRFPDNPVVVRLWRGSAVESVHRGAWCLVDASGQVLEGAGDLAAPFYARSSIKSMQALPLLETGAFAHYGLDDDHLAITLASHNAEPCHTEVVGDLLGHLGFGPEALRCGKQRPMDPGVAQALRDEGHDFGALHNNCSGKHAGFLAVAAHLGTDPAHYLDPDAEGQRLVRRVLAEMCDLDAAAMVPGIDGCSAPNYRIPLTGLATGFARVANPEGLAPERGDALRRITAAAGRRPELVAGHHERIDTDILRVSEGRLFAKIGAEGMYGVGVVGGDRGLALKIDDGGGRALHALLVALLEKLGLATGAELEGLNAWRDTTLRNRAGIAVGRIEAVIE